MYLDELLSSLGILLGIAAAIGGTVFFSRTVLPAWREQSLRARSRQWPKLQAHLDHACVTEYRPSDTDITFRLDAWFTYKVDDRIYEGTYANPDMRLDDAKRLLKRLNHEPVVVAYNPAKPGEHFFEPTMKKGI